MCIRDRSTTLPLPQSDCTARRTSAVSWSGSGHKAWCHSVIQTPTEMWQVVAKAPYRSSPRSPSKAAPI
eukprot:5243640-Lingulodinium_polyedra.AAC.1